MRRCRSILAAVFLAHAIAGCASAYVAAADQEGQAIAAEKSAVVDGFRKDLLDPTNAVPERKARAAPAEVPEVLTLGDAIRIATQHNRSFESQRESYFLSALGLGTTRRDFLEWIWSGSLSWNASDGRSVDLSESTALALSGSYLLPVGGSVSVSTSGSLGSSVLDGDRSQDAALSGSISFNVPLLQGAGRKIAFEGLTQAERSMVYSARDFELFRQNFAISITNQFYSLVSLKRGLVNAQRRVDNQQFLLNQARAQYKLELSLQQDVLRSERDYGDARNALLDAQQGYQLALDRFKVELGLPLDVSFEIQDEIPTPVELDITPEQAVAAAWHNRLDLLTLRQRLEDTERSLHIARDALKPDVNLSASYSINSAEMHSFRHVAFDSDSVTVGLSMEIPLNRRSQRNSYKSALLSLGAARRNLTQTEDNVILNVRDSLRRLHQTKQQIENDKARIVSIKRLIRRANLDTRAGLASNRDVTEAVNQLTDAENGLNDRYVSYYINRLNLLQSMGLLFVDAQGRIVQ